MRKSAALFCLITLLLVLSADAFADFKLRQQVTIGKGADTFTQERAIWVKGARERSENKILLEDARAAQMMPQIAEIRQCDLRQTIKLNDRSKQYFIEPFYESDDQPPTSAPSAKTETRRGGIVTITYSFTDTGERREMFGLTARRLIIKQVSETSKDSCQGESKSSMTEEGWFVYLIPENARCPVSLPRGEARSNQSCRDRLVMKGTYRYPGMMLEGTTKFSDLLKNDEFVTSIKTLDLSKETLAMTLFEIPTGYAAAASEQSLVSFGMNGMLGAINLPADSNPSANSSGSSVGVEKKAAINVFSGNVSKVNETELRRYLAEKISENGMRGVSVNSSDEISTGDFSRIIGVEIKTVKESGASKIGGLFGKVTGSEEAAKLGKSEAEIILTVYDRDGKTVIATALAKEKADGKADDAVKAALNKALAQIAPNLK